MPYMLTSPEGNVLTERTRERRILPIVLTFCHEAAYDLIVVVETALSSWR